MPDGTYLSALVNPRLRGRQREEMLQVAKSGAKPDPAGAHVVRVIKYDVPARDGGELVRLITTVEVKTDVLVTLATRRNRKPARHHRPCPRVVRRARHNSYRVTRPSDTGTRHPGHPA
ncbi:hypothetical protein [Kitasatospora sp. NPDC056181]|uniref:hypothetical protein n=1 Tax=Kitasatospora sp. NPDC056181 TaxID=3345737 RepID=UPI0035DFD9B6